MISKGVLLFRTATFVFPGRVSSNLTKKPPPALNPSKPNPFTFFLNLPNLIWQMVEVQSLNLFLKFKIFL